MRLQWRLRRQSGGQQPQAGREGSKGACFRSGLTRKARNGLAVPDFPHFPHLLSTGRACQQPASSTVQRRPAHERRQARRTLGLTISLPFVTWPSAMITTCNHNHPCYASMAAVLPVDIQQN
jgi:hypothetical protein